MLLNVPECKPLMSHCSRTDSKSIMRMKSGQMFAKEDLIRGRKLLHDGALQLKNSAGRLKGSSHLHLWTKPDVNLFRLELAVIFVSVCCRSPRHAPDRCAGLSSGKRPEICICLIGKFGTRHIHKIVPKDSVWFGAFVPRTSAPRSSPYTNSL